MKKAILFLFSYFIVAHFSCAQQKEFAWLTGTWKLKDKNVYEAWKLANDGKTLEGYSYSIKGSDTTIMEKIRLTYEGNSFHYIPDVQGAQGAVDFTVTQHNAQSFVAENPQHDFPKVIRYNFIRKDNTDFIEATIEGNGKVIPYYFERLK